MKFDGLEAVPPDWPACVVAIGVFDGVHRGHRAVLQAASELARSGMAGGSDLPVVALTFDPHPSAVVRPDSQPLMLSTLPRRVHLLRAAGADAVVVLPFTKELASWAPEEFVERALTTSLRARGVVVGDGFRFGHRASGDVDLLRKMGAHDGFDVVALAPQGDDSHHVTWSSTYVRQCVQEGDVAEAARALMRPHRVEGVIVHGDHRGRELGYPTANLKPVEHAAVPGDGVYAGWVVRGEVESGADGDALLPAAISIGTNPTFEGVAETRVEAYVLDRTDLDLYGEYVAFDFTTRLRPTLKFGDIESLVAQMDEDVAKARGILHDNR